MLFRILTLATILCASAPLAAATEYEICDPTGAACVVQEDGDCDGYGHMKMNEVYAAVAESEVYAHGLDSECADEEAIEQQRSVGFGAWTYAGDADTGAGFDWVTRDEDEYGHFQSTRTVFGGGAAVLGQGAYVEWEYYDEEYVECYTFVVIPGDRQDLGCPLGPPPTPPALPWGSLLP